MSQLDSQDNLQSPQATQTRIVTIGGGSGQYALLSSLRDMPNVAITAVVSMTDSGGSTGKLRDELGILPPGDVLKCILALSPQREVARELLLKRFSSGERLMGHNAGNMLLTMLGQYAGSFQEGIKALAEILDVKGDILPVTTDKATLVAELTNGDRVFGESAIDLPRGDQREKISSVFLVPHHTDQVSVNPPVLQQILDAHMILIGPGDLYTSIVPNLLVPGVKEALQNSRARICYLTNIMTKFGETDSYHAEDFIREVEAYVGRPLDEIIYNEGRPPEKILSRYAAQKSTFVRFKDIAECAQRYRLHNYDLVDSQADIARHDSGKLAAALSRLLAA
ncbi:YvcK family protein [Corallincola luteus]|uniref:Putative gluconeogenesis factor n=1 Tax=Corallincola luteus TaxID=1775177 RepID=A0ABY2ALE7_9GAMM|nr:gluconeogenesis factor YvcK family protein [Corallincola luteus]TCI03719.1 YvcK family protein [Corallincola luteus]